MSNTDDDIKGMEHSMQTVYIRMGTSHQPSCSLVSCLSLNLPALKPSAHGLDTELETSLTLYVYCIDKDFRLFCSEYCWIQRMKFVRSIWQGNGRRELGGTGARVVQSGS